MSFEKQSLVRFAHVDAAGIVFYPRYFEMLNAAVEDWFAAMGSDFATLHLVRRIGVPTVSLATHFIAPSRLGDRLDIRIVVVKAGRTSCTVRVGFTCAGQDRVAFDQVLVCIDLDSGRPIPWPEELATALAKAAAE